MLTSSKVPTFDINKYSTPIKVYISNVLDFLS